MSLLPLSCSTSLLFGSSGSTVQCLIHHNICCSSVVVVNDKIRTGKECMCGHTASALHLCGSCSAHFRLNSHNAPYTCACGAQQSCIDFLMSGSGATGPAAVPASLTSAWAPLSQPCILITQFVQCGCQIIKARESTFSLHPDHFLSSLYLLVYRYLEIKTISGFTALHYCCAGGGHGCAWDKMIFGTR